MVKVTKLLVSLFVIAGFSTAQAYRLSDYKEYKESRNLCMKRHSAESCARTIYLTHELLGDYESPLHKKLKNFSSGKAKYKSLQSENVIYNIGCSLGDPIQCYYHDMNAFKLKIFKEYSSYDSANLAMKYKRADEIYGEENRLTKKYIKGLTYRRNFNKVVNDWYHKSEALTIDEIKKRKLNGSLKTNKQKTSNSVSNNEEQMNNKIISYFKNNPSAAKRFLALPKSQQHKIYTSLKGSRSQVFNQLSRALRVVKPWGRPSMKLNHSHAGRYHSHKLPRQGKAHRHGNGAIGR